MAIHQILVDIQDALKTLEETQSGGSIADFKKQKQEGTRMRLKGAIQKLVQETTGDPDAQSLAKKLEIAEPGEMNKYLDKLAEMAAEKPETTLKIPRLPADVSEEINADLREIQACMKAGCYRSAVILCGRVMETTLHRKYYEATGHDLLEKAPGTGLGNLIAKLADKGVKLDPGLPNQIHLINQVRVFSVHAKKEPFTPSKTQAEAIVLYTLDILDKLFR